VVWVEAGAGARSRFCIIAWNPWMNLVGNSRCGSNLGPTVALKILPQSVAPDGARGVRFERDTKVLAALNHPNIAPLRRRTPRVRDAAG
jgi:serine/threonine protein kinase